METIIGMGRQLTVRRRETVVARMPGVTRLRVEESLHLPDGDPAAGPIGTYCKECTVFESGLEVCERVPCPEETLTSSGSSQES